MTQASDIPFGVRNWLLGRYVSFPPPDGEPRAIVPVPAREFHDMLARSGLDCLDIAEKCMAAGLILDLKSQVELVDLEKPDKPTVEILAARRFIGIRPAIINQRVPVLPSVERSTAKRNRTYGDPSRSLIAQDILTALTDSGDMPQTGEEVATKIKKSHDAVRHHFRAMVKTKLVKKSSGGGYLITPKGRKALKDSVQ